MDEVQIDKSGGVCRLTLAAPKRRNALNTQMAGALRDCLAEIAATKACKVLILEGEGPHFYAGMDLKLLSDANAESDRATFPLLWNETHCTLIGLEIPILVALEGAAVNAGAALALSDDLIVASRSSFTQTGEVQQNMPVPRNAGWIGLKHGEATALRFVHLADPPRAFTPRKVSSCRVSTGAQRLEPGKKGYDLVQTHQHR
jgi:enoyl-CoA hydratase/carnithine racemase